MNRPTPSAEFEIKLAIGRRAYDALLVRLPGRVAEVEQHNLFLDTADRRLSAECWSLRLRRETAPDREPRVLVTVKGPETRLAGAVCRTEIEARGDQELWERARAGSLASETLGCQPGDFLRETLGLRDPVGPVLDFTNRRTTFALELAGARRYLELDRTTFSTGQVDYEIEVELEPETDRHRDRGQGASPVATAGELDGPREVAAVTAALGALLESLGVVAEPALEGKYSRALRYAGL